MRAGKALSVALAVFVATAATARAERVAFVGCPVMRDMPEPHLPCWLANDGRQLYYLGLQASTIPPVPFYPPQLLHRVLVEGETVEGETVCGGLPLRNVRASVLPEIDRSCNQVLPPDGVTPPPLVRQEPPYREGFGQYLAASPPPGGAQRRMYPVPPPPTPPFEQRSFDVEFAFAEDFLRTDDGFVIRNAVAYFQHTAAARVVLETRRDSVRLTNGEMIEEEEVVALRRADRLRIVLTAWGVPDAAIETRIDQMPRRDGRRASITVIP